MKKNILKKVYALIFSVLACFCICFFGMKAEATMVQTKWTPFAGEDFYFQWNREGVEQKNYAVWQEQLAYSYTYYYNNTDKEYTLELKSKNPEVLEIEKEYRKTVINPKYQSSLWYYYKIKGVGKAVIECKIGDAVYEDTIYVTPGIISLEKIEQTGYQHVKLTWKKVKGVSGYVVQRTKVTSNNGGYDTNEKWENVKTVLGDNTRTTVVKAKWNTNYKYRVVGFVQAGTEKLYGNDYGNTLSFSTEKIGTKLKMVKKVANNTLKITWKKDKYATGYKIYRSEMENDGYKLVKKITKSGVTSWKQKVTKGKVYHYRIVTVYPEGESEPSASIAQIIPKKSAAKTHIIADITKEVSGANYTGNWANSDRTYYYQKSGKLHIVSVQSDGNLADDTLDNNGQIVSRKIINLTYETWGGFYKAPDGNFYVAVGYGNPDESKTKTVIEVIQYNSKWKKKKTAIIKGGVSNAFEGIYAPFMAGNCSMTMQGDVLYLFTARQMFLNPDDGLRHQSNISFAINTKTMKAKEANESYCSHSFNQLAKFKDGNLYLMDHGDAYPRSIYLQSVNNYKALQKERLKKGQGGYTIRRKEVFDFLGEIGDNYTGCTIGGMEIGKTNILTCGTSVPHNYAVNGVTGSGWEYKKNVYVVVTDKKMEKSQVKWLSNYDPKNSNVYIGDTRMVKLNEDRYAILYSVKENNITTVKYLVINNAGKIVYSKNYSGMEFKGGSQPIVYNGNITWLETSYKPDYSGTETKLYSIPAVW